MTGLVLLHHRDGTPVTQEALDACLSRLPHHDGVNTLLLTPDTGLGCQHLWVTPEAVGERQPLSDGDVHLMMDGRIDNRADLLAALPPDDSTLSDAALMLTAYRRWGAACFKRIVGPFAVIIVEPGRITLARDHLGQRLLFYHLSKRRLLVATQPAALLPHVSDALNERTLVRVLAIKEPILGETMFTGINEVLPAHIMTVAGDRVRQRHYWQPDLTSEIRYKTADEYAEHFLHLLRQSVQAHLRSPTIPAISLSGGYDSASVAGLAAQEGPLLSVSWLFDELPRCDERRYIAAMVQHAGLEPLYIPADDAWPLNHPDAWPHNPSMPEMNAFRLLRQRAYQAASDAGARVVLNPGFGNAIYTGYEYWLVDILRHRSLSEAAARLRLHLNGPGRLLDIHMRAAIRWALESVVGRNLPRRTADRTPWLNDAARALMGQQITWPPNLGNARRPAAAKALYGPLTTLHTELFFTELVGVDRRDPYHDRRLMAFVAKMPAYLLYDGVFYKAIIRHAMRGILPEVVRLRQDKSSLHPLYARLEREQATIERMLGWEGACWSRYIKGDPASHGLLPLWYAVSLEWWRQRRR